MAASSNSSPTREDFVTLRLNPSLRWALFLVRSNMETKPMRNSRSAAAGDHVQLDEAETVTLAYFQAAQRDGWSALVALAADALADRDDRFRQRGQQMSHGYVRSPVDV